MTTTKYREVKNNALLLTFFGVLLPYVLLLVISRGNTLPAGESPKVPAMSSGYDLGDITKADSQVQYGKELILHTAIYFGPNGKVAAISNGMNCGNCHLQAGTKAQGFDFSAVSSMYPKYRPRSGTVENVYKRIKDCFQRSLNGHAPDSASKEVQAMIKYILWVGAKVPRGTTPPSSGVKEPTLLTRAADPVQGKKLYDLKCQICHGADGGGKRFSETGEYTYPPVWGEHSFNDGAAMYRIGRLAGFLLYNMPFGATADKPQLSETEAWDIAAFVNSQARPTIDKSADWPKLSEKPYDNPFGPYTDSFSETRHKFGPFQGLKKP